MSIGKGILIGVLSLIIFAVILIAAFFVYLRFFEKPGKVQQEELGVAVS